MTHKYNIGDKVLYKNFSLDDSEEDNWEEDEIVEIDDDSVPYLLKSDRWAEESDLKPFEEVTNLFKYC